MEAMANRLPGMDIRTYDTGAVYWGEPGAMGQHSFYQLIHRGRASSLAISHLLRASVDRTWTASRSTIANVFAQAETLAFGKDGGDVAPRAPPPSSHIGCSGNRPSNVPPGGPIRRPQPLPSRRSTYEPPVFTQRVPAWDIAPSTNGAWNSAGARPA